VSLLPPLHCHHTPRCNVITPFCCAPPPLPSQTQLDEACSLLLQEFRTALAATGLDGDEFAAREGELHTALRGGRAEVVLRNTQALAKLRRCFKWALRRWTCVKVSCAGSCVRSRLPIVCRSHA
jgi:hypothetical protein